MRAIHHYLNRLEETDTKEGFSFVSKWELYLDSVVPTYHSTLFANPVGARVPLPWKTLNAHGVPLWNAYFETPHVGKCVASVNAINPRNSRAHRRALVTCWTT